MVKRASNINDHWHQQLFYVVSLTHSNSATVLISLSLRPLALNYYRETKWCVQYREQCGCSRLKIGDKNSGPKKNQSCYYHIFMPVVDDILVGMMYAIIITFSFELLQKD